jgi:hypothetical protein
MGRRVKDYWTFVNEDFLSNHELSKEITKILSPNVRKIRSKTKDEIEGGLGDGSKVGSHWDFSVEDNGFVGTSSLFGGKVVLKELSEDEDTERKYKVLTGPNKGTEGNFEWEGGERKWPIFDSPIGSNFSKLLAPDEEFFKTYKDKQEWESIISDLPGIKIVSKNDKGECEIEYDDIYQLYGKVRIYHNPNVNYPYFSYEVMDGPNKGKTGNSFCVLAEAQDIESPRFEGQGSLIAFSTTNNPVVLSSSYIDFPCNYQFPDPTKVDGRINKVSSNKKIPATGYNPANVIFLDTSEITVINPPNKQEFLKSYGKLTYKENNSRPVFGRNSKTGSDNFIPKSKYPTEQLFSSGAPPGRKSTYGDLPIKSNKFEGCYGISYYGNDLALYTVTAKKTETPKLDWNTETGCYSNNFFTGRFLTKRNEWKYLKGEWYYDYVQKAIGLLYAYDDSGKIVDLIYNPAYLYPDHYSYM